MKAINFLLDQRGQSLVLIKYHSLSHRVSIQLRLLDGEEKENLLLQPTKRKRFEKSVEKVKIFTKELLANL